MCCSCSPDKGMMRVFKLAMSSNAIVDNTNSVAYFGRLNYGKVICFLFAVVSQSVYASPDHSHPQETHIPLLVPS